MFASRRTAGGWRSRPGEARDWPLVQARHRRLGRTTARTAPRPLHLCCGFALLPACRKSCARHEAPVGAWRPKRLPAAVSPLPR